MFTAILGVILLFVWFCAMPNWLQIRGMRASLRKAGQYRERVFVRQSTKNK